MIDTGRRLTTATEPFLHHTADDLITPQDLARLNSTLPPADSFTRYVKQGPQHAKEYRMWLLAVYEQGSPLPAAGQLPWAWAQLLTCAVSHEFRSWLSAQTHIDLSGHPLDVGIYRREAGDFQGRATGKPAKAMNLTLFLNQDWSADLGGENELWSSNKAIRPSRRIVPRGGSCSTVVQSATSWHSIAPVRAEAGHDRLTMTLEYWKP